MKLETFGDIVAAIREAIGVQEADTRATNKIKRLVNMAYLTEVLPFKRWQWLEKTTQIIHKPYHGVGTASVTPESTTVTLSVSPNVGLGSFKGYRFSVNNSGAVYTVAAHTAGSATVTLTTAYQEAINATAGYKIWRDSFDLPVNAKETVELWHKEQPKPMDAVGSQGFRQLEAANPKIEGFPTHYNTSDFKDPSDGDGELESDRFRQVRLYPSITSAPVTINVDYIEEAEELVADEDEPLLPVGDRIVLYYLAGAAAWSIISRDEEMHDKWYAKGQAKLSRMAGEREEGQDTPTLSPKSGYMRHIRRSGLRRPGNNWPVGQGGSSYASPSFAKDITLEGGTITDDFTVSPGVTIDGRDISADGALLDSLVAPTSVALTNNTTNGTVALFSLLEADTVHLQYSVVRSGELQAGSIILTTNQTTVAISHTSAFTADVGITFTADISGGNIRLLYTSTNTGSGATLVYRKFSWITQ